MLLCYHPEFCIIQNIIASLKSPAKIDNLHLSAVLKPELMLKQNIYHRIDRHTVNIGKQTRTLKFNIDLKEG